MTKISDYVFRFYYWLDGFISNRYLRGSVAGLLVVPVWFFLWQGYLVAFTIYQIFLVGLIGARVYYLARLKM